jgi:dTDP-4-dehydrorhamnose reductase
MVNEGSISFYEIAQIMQENGLIEADKVIGRVSTEDFQASVKEKGGSYQPFPILSIEKLKAAGVSMRPVREAIVSTVKEYQS